jgi:hypothetical protein
VLFRLQPYYIFTLLLSFAYHLFSALNESNHKCTQPCHFPFATQTCCSEEEDGKNSSMRSYRLYAASVAVVVVLWSLPLFRMFHKRVILVFRDNIYVINIPYS